MRVKNGLKCLGALFAIFATLFLIAVPNASAIVKNIIVTDVTVKEKSSAITVEDPVLSNNGISSNITFNKKDDFVAFEFSLKNNESEKYKIESISDNNTNENIEIDYSFSEDYIDADELGTVTIKLTYKNSLINVDEISIDDLTIKIYLVNEEGEGGEIIINPTTSDALPFYCILFAAALVGLALLFKNKKSKAIKVCGVLFALSLLFIPLTTLAKEKYEVQIKFTDIDIIGEFETYNITINPGNGDEILVVPVQYGNKLESLPANPSKDGYDFDKWVDNNGNTVTSDTVITGQITVEAQYTIKHYAINYDLNGGSLPDGKTNPSDYTIEDEIIVNNPTKQGYAFTGWSGTGINGKTTNLVISAGSKDDRNYVANYQVNSFAVSFDTDGGTEIDSQTVEYGKKATRPTANPAKSDYYVFEDWYTTDSYDAVFDFSNTVITSNTIIYAKYNYLCKTFSTDSWTTIKDNLVSDPNYYAVGCEKEVEIDMDNDSTPESYTVRLANTSTPEVCSTEGYSQTACGLVIEFADIVIPAFNMNTNETSEGGWSAMSLARYLNGAFYNKLPADLRSVIIPTYPIVSGSGISGISPNITDTDTTKNKLYLSSAREVGFDLETDNKKDITMDTRTLDYYAANNNNNARIKKYFGTQYYWWLRSAVSDSGNYFHGVGFGGYASHYNAGRSEGSAPAFRIGIN